MEHLLPEQMYSTEDAQGEGVSAVQAIAIAVAEGQSICTITQDNLTAALSQIELGTATEQEIRNAVTDWTAHKIELMSETKRPLYSGLFVFCLYQRSDIGVKSRSAAPV